MKNDIYESLLYIVKYYNEPITKEKMMIYVENLSKELNAQELRAMFNLIVTRCKFFPSLAELLEIARGTKQEQALLSVNRIFEAINTFGFYRALEGLATLSEFDKDLIRSFGGWGHLARMQVSEVPIVRAQMRNAAVAQLVQEEMSKKVSEQALGVIGKSSEAVGIEQSPKRVASNTYYDVGQTN